MLILLTGAEGIGKKHIARAIVNQLNTFQYNNKTVEFRHAFDGNVQYVIDGNDYTNLDEINPLISDVITWASQTYEDVFLDYIKACRCFDTHVDLDFDMGLTTEAAPLTGDGSMLHNVDVLNIYANKPAILNTAVVYGSFSKPYLQMLKNELGEDIKIINITRNPSASWLFNYKPDDFYDSPTKPDLNADVDKQKFIDSTIITGLNSSLDFVETIKFENIINDGLYIDGTKITLGKGYRPHNEYISKYEYDNHTQQDLTEVNTAMSTFNPLWFIPTLNTVVEDSYINTGKAIVPNIFNLYPDYEPLSYAQITTGAPQ